MKKYLYKLLPIVFLINFGCSDQKIESSKTWTLYDDAEVISISPLIEGTQSSVRIEKGEHDYIVSILDIFQCGTLEEKLYLSLPRNGKLTLELPKPNRNSNGCEEHKTVKVKIKRELAAGDTLYILNGSEVISHITVPK
jgi:hypothetical protein